jgi:hypothetical protein
VNDQKLFEKCIQAVEREGVLLLFPVENKPEPRALWHVLFPGEHMRWAWDETADRRVVGLWHLKVELSRSERVVYSKWLGGRATLFSLELFRAMLNALRELRPELDSGLSSEARDLLDVLRDDSPKSTKALRRACGLLGKEHETAFNRGMRELWERGLVVGAGEEDEGGYPSLSVGATELLFEDLWKASLPEAAARTRAKDRARLDEILAKRPSFARAFRRVSEKLRAG